MVGAAAGNLLRRLMRAIMTNAVPPLDWRPVRFYLITFVATWIPWVAGVVVASRPGLTGTGGLFNLIGLLAPAAACLTLTFGGGSPALKADFKSRFVGWSRIRARYLIPALLMPPAVMALALGVSVAIGGSRDQLRLAAGGNLAVMIVVALVLAPIIEETGWRGYGVDSLTSRLGRLRGSLLFGVIWSVWHAPLVLIPGTYQHDLAAMPNHLYLANFFVSVIPAAVIANWFFYRNGRSILAAVLLHAMINASSVLPNAGQPAKCVVTLIYSAIAIGLIAADRGFWHPEPAASPGDPASTAPGPSA